MGPAGNILQRPSVPSVRGIPPRCRRCVLATPYGVHVRPLTLLSLSAALALALGLVVPAARGQDTRLPDMGSSAAMLLTPKEEQEYGEYTLFQLRHYGYVLEDPLIDSWLGGMGH